MSPNQIVLKVQEDKDGNIPKGTELKLGIGPRSRTVFEDQRVSAIRPGAYVDAIYYEPGLMTDYIKVLASAPTPQNAAPNGREQGVTLHEGAIAIKRGNYATALTIFRTLAAQGDAGAQSNLGTMYEQGLGVAHDYAEAVKWYRLVAAQGDANGQYNLGVMYSNGKGVARDYAEAVKWYRLAAAQGDASAQSNLGLMYYDGKGVAQDYSEAVKLYRLAAAQGDAGAHTHLGVMYYYGKGVAQDFVRADMWFNLGAVSGDEATAVKNRDIIEKRMTPQQIAQARKMARDCERHNFKQCD